MKLAARLRTVVALTRYFATPSRLFLLPVLLATDNFVAAVIDPKASATAGATLWMAFASGALALGGISVGAALFDRPILRRHWRALPVALAALYLVAGEVLKGGGNG